MAGFGGVTQLDRWRLVLLQAADWLVEAEAHKRRVWELGRTSEQYPPAWRALASLRKQSAIVVISDEEVIVSSEDEWDRAFAMPTD